MMGISYSVQSIMHRLEIRLQTITNYEEIMKLEPYPYVSPFSKTRKRRFIESLHNRHLGQEIWPVGCGPSLDDFPEDFFDDKLTIGANWSIIVFPNMTYWKGDAGCWIFFRKYRPEIFRRTFLRFPLIPNRPEENRRAMEAIFGEYRFDPIRVRWMRGGGWERFQQGATEAITSALKGSTSFMPPHYFTSIHQIIQMAVYLGAKKITLAGCEAEPRCGHHHAVRGNLRYFYCRKEKRHPYTNLKRGTKFLANLLKQYGIEVRCYFYNKGYVEV